VSCLWWTLHRLFTGRRSPEETLVTRYVDLPELPSPRLSVRPSVCHRESNPRRLFDFPTLIDVRIGSIASQTIVRVFIRLGSIGTRRIWRERRPIRHNYAPSAHIMPLHLSMAKWDDGIKGINNDQNMSRL